MKSYFKTRKWYKRAAHRYEVGRLLANNKRSADSLFLIKMYELDLKEYEAFYQFHLRYFLKRNSNGEREFYEHVWYLVEYRIDYYQHQNPFSSGYSTALDSLRKLRAFQKLLHHLDKWNARPYPILVEEKDKQMLQQQEKITELEERLSKLKVYEVQQKIRIKQGHLPTFMHVIKQLSALELSNGDSLLKCQNNATYAKLVSKYFTHGVNSIPLETARNYFVGKNNDLAIKGTFISEKHQLFEISRKEDH